VEMFYSNGYSKKSWNSERLFGTANRGVAPCPCTFRMPRCTIRNNSL